MANYMGDYYSPGVADNYQLILSDLGWDEEGWELPNATYYVFDLYTEIVDGELAIPYGTYELDMTSSYEPNTIDASYTKYILLDEEGWDYADEAYFTEGTITVDTNGIVAELVAEDGTLHNVVFEGTVTEIVDYSSEFGDGYYEVLKSNLKTYVTFARMRSTSSSNNWGNILNQANNLTVPTNGDNLYIVETGTWSKK